ncbi:hypothetical protein PQC39_gp134 [Vibrio phage Vp_R1]|uniref:Uncharacterized protein n=1 Tax=Vibrio phage Vp_R1 TaxID=2059867 RepID=A0A2H5BQ87_9CAUD|nr:hypothetical protein PQC39_gp134 [Vibrio phage Vp_R1]AUG88498.1 hypothetical protein VPR_134 [Vibrio phage Vp_R1]
MIIITKSINGFTDILPVGRVFDSESKLFDFILDEDLHSFVEGCNEPEDLISEHVDFEYVTVVKSCGFVYVVDFTEGDYDLVGEVFGTKEAAYSAIEGCGIHSDFDAKDAKEAIDFGYVSIARKLIQW